MSLKVLLVENSRTARAVLSQLLEKQGYTVDTAATGSEAITSILQSDHDVVIMDLFLPQMNGYEAAKQVRLLDSPKSLIPIVAFTSSTSESDKQLCKDAGMNDYVIKSESNEALLAVLKTYEEKRTKTG